MIQPILISKYTLGSNSLAVTLEKTVGTQLVIAPDSI